MNALHPHTEDPLSEDPNEVSIQKLARTIETASNFDHGKLERARSTMHVASVMQNISNQLAVIVSQGPYLSNNEGDLTVVAHQAGSTLRNHGLSNDYVEHQLSVLTKNDFENQAERSEQISIAARNLQSVFLNYLSEATRISAQMQAEIKYEAAQRDNVIGTIAQLHHALSDTVSNFFGDSLPGRYWHSGRGIASASLIGPVAHRS